MKYDFKRLYPVILILIVYVVWTYRKQNTESSYQKIQFAGITMGTIQYNVTYYDLEGRNFSVSIDSLLKDWNQSLSTYIPNSEISRFNKGDSCFLFESKYFYPVLQKSKEVHKATIGNFDPTVQPLVNAWGFGPQKQNIADSSTIDSLVTFVGFDKIEFNENQVCKADKRVQLDFSAIAKGYAVDVVTDFLEKRGIEAILVEIGGELVTKGLKPDGSKWITGIEAPTSEVSNRVIQRKLPSSNEGIATSGNYRNYYEKDGRKYVHTIDPFTGYTKESDLLSATVIASDCMTADAYATAFMVMGASNSMQFLENHQEIEAFLVYVDQDGMQQTFSTPKLEGRFDDSAME